jgi:murein DD-endopeptidase MepM/ murein hydrolase activator NlpD
MRNTERAERGSRVRNRLVAASVALLVGVGGPVVVAAPAQAVTMVSITTSTGTVNRPVLKVGMKNIHVQWVQAKLGVKKTGYFGPLTQGAVKRYQASKGIPTTGVVARLTWTSLLKGSSAPAASVNGKFCPAPGAWLGSGWGDRRWHGPHQGIDMMGKRGDPLLAVEDGFVVRQGALANGQLRVVLQGVSGARYYYGHNDRNLVTAGQRVEAGQRIATMGNTGTVAVHLHFEYWPTGQDRSAIDPRPLVTSLCR